MKRHVVLVHNSNARVGVKSHKHKLGFNLTKSKASLCLGLFNTQVKASPTVDFRLYKDGTQLDSTVKEHAGKLGSILTS